MRLEQTMRSGGVSKRRNKFSISLETSEIGWMMVT